jgi:hypothetical protein
VTVWLETRRVFVMVVALGLFAMAARNVTDPDVWWHLRTGQLIAQAHTFVHTDPYSFTHYGQPWVNHEWLSDVLIYSLFRVAGWTGLIVIFAALTAATFMLIFLRCGGRPYLAGFVLVLGAYVSAPSWGVRPHTTSLFIASVFLLVLDRSEQRPRLLWWTVPLTLLWVNLHAEYALGIALIAVFLLGEWLETLGERGGIFEGQRLRNLALALLGCLAVVPLNPNGFRMYAYPIDTLRSPAMQHFIAEWSSPNFHEAKYVPFLLMLLALVFLLGRSRRKIRPRELLLLLVTTAGALRSVRHISVWALVAVPILSGLIWGWWGERGRSLVRAGTGPSRRVAFNLLVLVGVLGFAGVRVYLVAKHQSQNEAEHFPASAVRFLTATRPPAPIFNHYNFGGYLIWKLYPDYPVYIDGRADLYGDQFLNEFAGTYYVTDPKWGEHIQHWKIQTILLPPDAPLVAALKLSHEWTEVYTDAQAAILTRTQ